MVQDNTISVNDFVNDHPTPSQCLKCVLLNHFNVGNKIPSTEILELRVQESDKVDGLKVTYRSDVSTKQESAAAKNSGTNKPPLVVGTIRMGFGHHRIAYAVTRDTSQKFGIWGFCRNFLQKYCDSLKRDSIFWQGSPTVLGDYRQIRFLRCYSDGPNRQIRLFG
jgi:hypothetical protein